MSVPSVHSHSHSHNMAVISQNNYMAVAAASQAFPASQNTYVIHRGSGNRNSSAHAPSASSATNFYIQAAPMTHSHAPPTPSALTGTANHQTTVNSCSLSKLQQLTNGLDMIAPSPGQAMNLTPPPTISHTMTPPQSARQSLSTPPQVPLSYAKNYYNVNASSSARGSPGSSSTSSRSSSSVPLAQSYANESLYRQTLDPGGACAQMQSAGRVSASNVAVTLNQNLMAAQAAYGYRVAAQGPTTNYMNQAAAQLGGFMNQASQIPVGVVNVATPYAQDPHQQNTPTVYTAYHGYINGGLMQPLNGSMRPR